MASQTRAVFAYGTLSFAAVMEAVTGRRLASEPASLEGWARVALRGRSYPGLLERAGAETAGALYRAVDDDALAALDRFEGECYERRALTVRDAAGARVRAEVWVIAPRARDLLRPEPWCPERFEREQLADFLRGLSGSGS